MNSRHPNLLWIILLFAFHTSASDPVPAEKQSVNNSQSLLDAVKPGMTHAEADRIVRRLIGDDRWAAGPSLEKNATTSRYSLSDGTCLLLTYENVADRQGNLGANDKVAAVRLVHFDDLKMHVPDELFEAVRLIHYSPSIRSTFDPTSLIRAVNGLLPLGKEKALKALRAYETLCDEDVNRSFQYNLDEERIFLIVRLLFVRNDGEARMPRMLIGATTPEIEPGNKDWPLFPLTVQNDIPFCLSSGYALGGQAEPPSRHLDYCQKNCGLRKSPLHPSISPLKAIESFCASEQWHRLFKTSQGGEDTQYLLRLQSLSAVSNITQTPLNTREFCPTCVSKKDADKAWEHYSGDDRLMNATWDADGQRFVAGRAGVAKQ